MTAPSAQSKTGENPAGASALQSAPEKAAALKLVAPIRQDTARTEVPAVEKPAAVGFPTSLSGGLETVKGIVLPAATAVVAPLAQAVAPRSDSSPASGQQTATAKPAPEATAQSPQTGKSAFSTLADLGASLIPQGVKDAFSKATDFAASLIPQGVKQFWSSAVDMVGNFIRPVVDACRSVIKSVSSLFGGNKTDEGNVFSESASSNVGQIGVFGGLLGRQALRRYAENTLCFRRGEDSLYGVKRELKTRSEAVHKAEAAVHTMLPDLPPDLHELVLSLVKIGTRGEKLTTAAVQLANGQLPEEIRRRVEQKKRPELT